MKPRIALLTILLITVPVLGLADEPADKAAADKKQDVPEAKVSVTQHDARIGGRTVHYTATAGTMEMKNDDGDPVALMGYTAYVDDSANKAERPIIFAYNGGPGSASLWLHMGVLGPQRVVAPDGGFGSNGPFKRVANEYSIIDKADLVMIDPVGTGFAKVIGKGKVEDFWGVDQDIKSVSEFIVKYVTDNGRWASPKYILGESYGGMRSGGVVLYLLNNHMLALNGVVLVSPFMAMSTGFAGLGIDLPHVMFLPTFAATAWYHNLLADKPGDFQAFIDEVKNFALTDYGPALMLGSNLPAERRAGIISKLSRYTGLSEDYWDRANLRIDEGKFTKELMRRTGKTTGRIDSRFVGDMLDRLGEEANYDPMTTAIGPAYLAAFMDYYRKDLKVEDTGEYVVFGNVFGKWDWSHRQPDLRGFKLPFPNTNVDLGQAIVKNPSMKVMVLQGYFDLATPFLATEYYIDHLDIPQELRGNVSLHMFQAGHMMYVHEPSLVKFRNDLAGFVDGTH